MMKKMMMTAMLTTIVVAAQAMSLTQARQEALFLSDKMAYELRLTEDQFEAVYEINLDYFLSIRYEEDVFGVYWNRRNTDLRFVLTTWQYRKFISTADFYQPAQWRRGSWVFSIYSRYNRGNHFRQPPTIYGSYNGGRNRGTISFYENRNIRKPDPRPNGQGWSLQPTGNGGNPNGNNHFAQPGGNNQPNGNRPNSNNPGSVKPSGTDNRSGNANTGTRRFGTGNSGSNTQPGNSKTGGNTGGTQPPKQSTQPGNSSSQNSNGHFGGARKK